MAEPNGAAATPGMPQLDFGTFPNQIFWLVIAIVAIYLLLSRVALPRIGAVLAERRGTITNDLMRAEELRQKAEEAEAAYQKALADAKAEANRIVAKARAEMQEELDIALQKADAEIAARASESERRIGEIGASAAEAVAIVARDTVGEVLGALGQSADATAIEAAVAARLKKQEAA